MLKRLCLLPLLFTFALLANAPATTRQWTFNQTLAEQNGHCPFFISQPQFTTTPSPALILRGNLQATSNDDDFYLPRPGFRLKCKFSLDANATWDGISTTIVRKGAPGLLDAFMLRIDPRSEGSRISFFLNLDGRLEPRVSSPLPAEPGKEYDVSVHWDGKRLTMTINGETRSVARTGRPHASPAPLTLGSFPGAIAGLTLENSTDDHAPAGHWPFNGSLEDISGHGQHFAPPPQPFPVDQQRRRSLELAPLSTPGTPRLKLIPGFRLACNVQFDHKPLGETVIAYKEGDYLLRYDPKGTSGAFNCFFFVNGRWEPRLSHDMDIEPQKWYSLHAFWDGRNATFSVNGQSKTISRAGKLSDTQHPLTLGSFNGRIRNLVIATRPTVSFFLEKLKTEELMLFAGQPATLTGLISCVGDLPADTVLTATPDSPITITPREITIPKTLGAEPRRLQWQISAPTDTFGNINFTIRKPDGTLTHFSYPVAFMPVQEPDYSAKSWSPPTGNLPQAKTYYIDSQNGDNHHDGLSPLTPWRDFTNINGKTLQPGDRLLLRRGSVFNQELKLSAKGTPQAWAEISAYGEGPRPTIRRNRDIDDICASITNPDYLVIRNLIVCNAGRGLIVTHTRPGHAGLLIENCLAHHIEGHYRPNSHGIPEWFNRGGVRSAGFSFGRRGLQPPVVFRDNEMYQCSVAFAAHGTSVYLDRIFCHDNFCHNTSPHPFTVSLNRSYLLNSIFDASGWNASAGTMGIMLGHTRGFIIRDSHFLNQPDSGSHDEGGIDFEADGEHNLIDRCTFRNNAGAAIEVLGLRTPQTRNIVIQNCRFDQNNQALKLGPAEIFIWSGSKDPLIVCSNGLIQNNGYVLKHGVSFFSNKAQPGLTDWTLKDNRQFNSTAELDRAFPYNNPPVPSDIPEIWTDQPANIPLHATVSDDQHPAAPNLSVAWSQLDGPGLVSFAQPNQTRTTASFPRIGDYRLQLKADDGQFWRTTRTAVHILPPHTSVLKAWTFGRNLDKEGWTSHGLGTVKEHFTTADPFWNTFAEPVDIVGGDTYTFAIKNAAAPAITSPTPLELNAQSINRFAIKFQNHTNATGLKLFVKVAGDEDWRDAQTLDLVPHDNDDRLYTLALNPTGTIQQLKLLFLNDEGENITGTCRIDYIWLGNAK